VVDASQEWTEADSGLLSRMRPLGPLLIACNKADLPHKISNQSEIPLPRLWDRNDRDTELEVAPVVWTSALSGEGIPELKEKILEIAAPARDLGLEGEFITNLRHQQLLQVSLQALAKAHQAAEQNLPHEMLLLDLYEALRPLDQITGATYVDDVLDIIFSTFCVGK
jgi:tRNA modification GTPase